MPTWNWASSGSPAKISSVTKWTPRCWGRRCSWKRKKWKVENVQRVTLTPSASAKLGFKSEFEIYHLPLEPSVRTDGQTRAAGIWGEKGGLEEKNGLSILQRKNGTSLRERPIISEEWVVTTASSFYRTACLSEGRGHGSGSVSRRRSWLGGSRARGLCTFRDVPVRCRRVVAVPVHRCRDHVMLLEAICAGCWCQWLMVTKTILSCWRKMNGARRGCCKYELYLHGSPQLWFRHS